MTQEECIALLNRYAEYNGIGIPNLAGCREAMRTAAELLQRTSLPSNLDEAAEEYSENILANNEDLQDAIEDAFKAGAEWMAGQGVKFDTDMSWLDSFGFQIGWPEDTSIFDCFNPGDKVVIQIRKK